jgi:hypothetical protein
MSSSLDAPTAWRALLEPFVGLDNIQHHEGGLRIETARVVRQLFGLGIRAEFDFPANSQDIDLILRFHSAP